MDSLYEQLYKRRKNGKDRLIPVSYTHLDVYKRQMHTYALYNMMINGIGVYTI